MNTKIIALLTAVALIAGCASVKKTTQTNADGTVAADAGYDKYENYQNSNEDQYLRMKVQDPALWGGIDDYSYWNNSSYDFGYSCDASRAMLLGSFYNPYGFGYYPYGLGYAGFGYGLGWYSWYSPYQTIVYYKNPTVYYSAPGKYAPTALSPGTRSIYPALGARPLSAPSTYLPARRLSTASTSSYSTPKTSSGSARTYSAPRTFSSSGSFGGGGGHIGGGGGGGHVGGGHH